MPSPIGHALGGVICALTLGGERPSLPGPARAPVAPGSAGAAWRRPPPCCPTSTSSGAGTTWRRTAWGLRCSPGSWPWRGPRGRGWRFALVVAAAWASHVLFDWLGSDDTPPLGVMALWPLSRPSTSRTPSCSRRSRDATGSTGFWAHNLWALATEVVMLAPVAAAGGGVEGRPWPTVVISGQRGRPVGRRAAASAKYSPTVLASLSG